MNTKLLLATIFLIGFSSNSVVAQRTCHTDIKNHHKELTIPGFSEKYNQVDHYIKNNTDVFQTANVGSNIVTIPVVVHVLYKNQTQNISEAQINSQINILNQDFRKLNTDFSSVVPSYFQSFGADIEIEFVLAKRTPNGQATTGIERKAVGSNFVFEDQYYTSSGLLAWDTTQYLNIWVGRFSDDELLGFAYHPSSHGYSDDGLCIGDQFFGNVGTVVSPFNKGRTATHEIGHYFGLDHIWGRANGSTTNCGVGIHSDNVADTPATKGSYSGCPTTTQKNLKTCVTSTNGAMYMNYMDYVNDACMAFFTLGQKTVMRNALNGPRLSLLSSMGGVALGQEDFAISKAVRVYPNPTNNSVSIDSPLKDISEIEIYNNLGQLIISNKLNSATTNINLQEFPTGLYILKIYGNDGKLIKSDKIIKR